MELKQNDNEYAIVDLRCKYAERSWNDTQLLVRRCMENSHNFKSNKHILNCLGKLHKVINVCSMKAMISRLETIAQQKGLGSHISPTEPTYYLTSDMFYAEVMLSGEEVIDVKLAQRGEAPVSSELLLELLRFKKFDEFSVKIDCLNSFYNIPGDNETKIKIFTALQCVEKDLLKISYLPRLLRNSDLHVDTVLNGRAGHLVPFKEGNPMTIKYYLSPQDYLLKTSSAVKGICGHLAFLMAGSCDSAQRLPISSLIPQPPQIDVHGLPVFTPLEEGNSEVLPACFLLRLQPPLPMMSSFICKIEQLTKMTLCEDNIMWMSFLQLLLNSTLNTNGNNDSWENYVLLPENQLCRCILSEGVAALLGTLVHSIPFTHPRHVPPVLELLRHQSTLNTLLASCITNYRPHRGTSPGGFGSGTCCEVILESDSKISVYFSLPNDDTLSVLMVNLEDSRQVSCKLFPPSLTDGCTNDYLSTVIKRCMSIPVTLRCLSSTQKKNTAENSPAALLVTNETNNLPVAPGVPSWTVPTNMSTGPFIKNEGSIPMETSGTISQNATMS